MIEITSIPSGEQAITDIKELMINDAYSDDILQRMLNRNAEGFDLALKILDHSIQEQVENNMLNSLQNLESWMNHNRTFRGTHQCFLALRILNTHLTRLFFERYR